MNCSKMRHVLTLIAWVLVAVLLILFSVLLVFRGSFPRPVDKHAHPSGNVLSTVIWVKFLLGNWDSVCVRMISSGSKSLAAKSVRPEQIENH